MAFAATSHVPEIPANRREPNFSEDVRLQTVKSELVLLPVRERPRADDVLLGEREPLPISTERAERGEVPQPGVDGACRDRCSKPARDVTLRVVEGSAQVVRGHGFKDRGG